METKHNDQTNAAANDFSHIKEFVLDQIESTIDWRKEKADEFDDYRNLTCADNLQELHQKLSELPETHEFFRAVYEMKSNYDYFINFLGQFGFHGELCPNWFLQHIIELVQEEKEV